MTDTDQAAKADDVAKRLVWRVTSDNGQPVYPGGSGEFRKDIIAAAAAITRLRTENDALRKRVAELAKVVEKHKARLGGSR